MRVKMNYRKIHDRIIEKRRLFPLDENEYGEIHHILPKSLGGSNSTENLIRLSAKEHFVIHLLLIRIFPIGSIERGKMLYAMKRMRYGNKAQRELKNSSRMYEYHRKEISEVMSKKHLGKPKTIEHRQRISQAKTGKSRNDLDRYRKTTLELWKDPEYAKKQSEAKIGKQLSESHRKAISKSRSSSPRSEETKAKISQTKLANRLANPDSFDRHQECVYCGKKTNAANIARYHNEKCKYRFHNEKKS